MWISCINLRTQQYKQLKLGYYIMLLSIVSPTAKVLKRNCISNSISIC